MTEISGGSPGRLGHRVNVRSGRAPRKGPGAQMTEVKWGRMSSELSQVKGSVLKRELFLNKRSQSRRQELYVYRQRDPWVLFEKQKDLCVFSYNWQTLGQGTRGGESWWRKLLSSPELL